MKIITVISAKGGVGKTTAAVTIAQAFREYGYRAAVFDTDLVHSALEWGSEYADDPDTAKLLPPVEVLSAPYEQRLRDKSAMYDIAVIDGGAGHTPASVATCKLADLALVPITPDPLALKQTMPTLQDLMTLEAKFGSPKTLVFMSKANPQRAWTRKINNEMEKAGVAMAETVIPERVAFSNAYANGETVLTTANATDEAIAVRNLVKEIADRLELVLPVKETAA